jgi:hypothetical protein
MITSGTGEGRGSSILYGRLGRWADARVDISQHMFLFIWCFHQRGLKLSPPSCECTSELGRIGEANGKGVRDRKNSCVCSAHVLCAKCTQLFLLGAEI